MSINSLLTNLPVLEAVKAYVGGGGGGGAVDSVGANLPLTATAGANPVISLPISGVFSAGVTDYVKGSSATALEWGAGGGGGGGAVDSVTAGNNFITIGGSAANPTVALNAAAGTAGQFLQLENAATGAMVWAAGGGGGSGTVTSVAAGDTFIEVTGSPTVNPSVSLAVGLPAASGDVLSSTTAGVLSWITPGGGGGGTVTEVFAAGGAGAGLIVSNPTTTPVVGLNCAAAGTTGQVLSQSATLGELEWVNPPTGTVESVDVTPVGTAGAGLKLAASSTATNPVLALNVSANGENGNILSTDGTGNLTWIPPSASTAGTLANFIFESDTSMEVPLPFSVPVTAFTTTTPALVANQILEITATVGEFQAAEGNAAELQMYITATFGLTVLASYSINFWISPAAVVGQQLVQTFKIIIPGAYVINIVAVNKGSGATVPIIVAGSILGLDYKIFNAY